MNFSWGIFLTLSSRGLRSLKSSQSRVEGITFAFLTAAFLSVSSQVFGSEREETSNFVTFNIPRQPAESALIEFAEQADLTLVARFNEVSGKTANALIGTFSLEDAANVLLIGTGLKPTFRSELVLNITTTKEKEEGIDMDNKTKGIFAGVIAAFVGTSAVAQDQSASSGFSLEEVIVTARKIEERLQDTPVAVSAFTAEGIEQRGYTDISDLANATPNLVFDTAPPISGNSAGAAVFLRGVGQLDFTVNVDPGVGVYVDGVYMSRSIGSVVDLIDIDRVEILRGPQGTLFGRNTIGGAIQIVSKAPGDELAGSIKTTIGDDDRLDLNASIDIPFSDSFRSRFSLLSSNRDGYVTDGRGVDLGDDSSVGLRARFDWDVSEDLNFSLIADYTEDDENGAPNVPIELFAFDGDFGLAGGGASPTGADDFGTRFNFFAPNCPFDEVSVQTDPQCFGPQQASGSTTRTDSDFPLTKSDNEIGGISLTANYDLGWGAFKSVTAYRSIESEFGRDSDHSPFPIFATANLQDQDQFSQEFQLSGVSEFGRWVLGAYYFEEEAFEFTQIFLPAFGGPVLLNGLFYNDVDNDSTALYGEYTFNLSDAWALTVGGRYTDDSKSYASDQGFILINQNVDGTAVFAGFDPTDPSTNPEQLATFEVFDRAAATSGDPAAGGFVVTLIDDPGQTADFTETTWRSTLSYKPNEETLVYGTFSNGYKSGGFNPRYLAPTSDLLAISFDPEFVDNFELGYKYFGSSFRANFAAFRTDYDDIQISADSPTSSGATVTQNAAAATITGLEGEFTYIPNDLWLIEGGFGWLDAEYDELGAGVQSNVTLDSEFARIPEFTANLGISRLSQLNNGGELSYRLDGSYRGDSEGTVQNDPQAFEDSYTIWNASISYETPRQDWRFSGGITNIGDEEYFHSANVNQRLGYSEAVFARGREFFLSAQWRFNN